MKGRRCSKGKETGKFGMDERNKSFRNGEERKMAKTKWISKIGATLFGVALLFLSASLAVHAEEVVWTGNEWNVSEQEMKEVKNLN